jgi:Tfp pilus assembly protein PilF
VQKIGDRIRLTVQLLRASDGTPLWTGKFDEKYTDVFSLEDRISEEVAAALVPTLTGDQKRQLARHYTEDTAAYQSYTKGRYFWNKRTTDGLTKAISYFEDAIIQDPNYALAYAGLADSYTTLGILDDLSSPEMMPKARSAALKALELDEGLAEAHASLGYVKHRFEWDWAGAEQEFKRSIDLNPDYATAHQWYGWYLITVGSFAAALQEFERARQIEPLSLYTNLTVGAAYFYLSDYDRAAAQFRKVIEMDPSFGAAHRWLAKTNGGLGKQKVVTISNSSASAQAALGYAYSIAGKQAEAREILATLQRLAKTRYVSPYSLAAIYSGLRENDHAFEWLEKDFQERENSLVFLAVDPQFVNLRSDPRFANLVRRVGIPH